MRSSNSSLTKVVNFELIWYIKTIDGVRTGKEYAVETLHPRKDCFSVLSSLQNCEGCSWGKKYLEFYSYLTQYDLFILHKDRNFKLYELSLNLLHPNQRHYPRDGNKIAKTASNYRVEREFVQCDKTVWVGSNKIFEADREYLERKYNWIKFTSSKETLHTEYGGVAFVNPGKSRVLWHYKYLVESGISGRLEAEFENQKNFKRKRAAKKTPPKSNFTMYGNISTFFILWAGLLMGGGLVFIGELVKTRIIFKYCTTRISTVS